MNTTNNKKFESISGKLISLPQTSRKEGRKTFSCFRMETEKGFIWMVKTFAEIAEQADTQLTQMGVPVSIQGYREPENDSVFVANFIRVQNAVSLEEKVTRYWGSVEGLKKCIAASRRPWESLGYVKTRNREGHVIWDRPENCVEMSDGRWVQRIEFVMDTFGAENITAELHALIHTGNSGLPLLTKKNVKVYKDWLARKTLQAAKLLGA